MLPEMFASMLLVPGRCYKPRGLPLLLLCKLGSYREAYGNDNTSTVSYSAHGRRAYGGILGSAFLIGYKISETSAFAQENAVIKLGDVG